MSLASYFTFDWTALSPVSKQQPDSGILAGAANTANIEHAKTSQMEEMMFVINLWQERGSDDSGGQRGVH